MYVAMYIKYMCIYVNAASAPPSQAQPTTLLQLQCHSSPKELDYLVPCALSDDTFALEVVQYTKLSYILTPVVVPRKPEPLIRLRLLRHLTRVTYIVGKTYLAFIPSFTSLSPSEALKNPYTCYPRKSVSLRVNN